jgi:hypothetical protein
MGAEVDFFLIGEPPSGGGYLYGVGGTGSEVDYRV